MKKALTTNDITKELSKDIYSRLSFIGVFPRDRLPDIYKYPCSFVLNTHPSSKIGEHWIAFYFNQEKKCDFFDSFGLPPSYYNLEKYINKFSFSFNYNKIQLQNFFSSSCGYYCIFFILLRCRHFSLKDIVEIFSKSDFSLNDFRVENIFN